MHKIISMTNYKKELQWHNNSFENMKEFLRNNDFDGIELVQFGEYNEEQIPKEEILGLHMRFYPSWIDLWRGDEEKLIEKFGSVDNIEMLYGGTTRECLIEYYKKELQLAKELEVKYVVMHVCHVDFNETYSYDFQYSDEEVVKCSIELINEIFQEEFEFELLMENLWWPGLKLMREDIIQAIIEGVNYSKIGFMLDTGHMLNTNLDLKDSKEGIEYILSSLDKIKKYTGYIKGVHLNYSLSGDYVKRVIEERKTADEYSFKEVFSIVYGHISNIDKHDPFEDEEIYKIFECLDLEYLVYEFIPKSKEELQRMIHIQDRYINNKSI